MLHQQIYGEVKSKNQMKDWISPYLVMIIGSDFVFIQWLNTHVLPIVCQLSVEYLIKFEDVVQSRFR